MKYDTFFSYSSLDRETVARVVKFLEAEFTVWWDRDLVSGSRYEDVIFSVIDRADLVLVGWSRNAAGSDWVEREAKRGLETSTVVPILLDETPLPDYLASLDAIDMRDWDGTETAQIRKLIRDGLLRRNAAVEADASTIAAIATEEKSEILTTWDLFWFALFCGVAWVVVAFIPVGNPKGWIFITSAVAWFAIVAAYFISAIRLLRKAPNTGTSLWRLGTRRVMWTSLNLIGLVAAAGLVITDTRLTGEPVDANRQLAESVRNRSNDQCLPIEGVLRQSLLKAFEGVSTPTADAEASARFTAELLKSPVGVAALLVAQDTEAPSVSKALRPSGADEYYAAGCLAPDWNILTRDEVGPIQRPPFTIDLSSKAGWEADVRRALDAGDVAAARDVLSKFAERDAGAANVLGVVEALTVTRGGSPSRALPLFKAAAADGNMHAMANLGFAHIFGIGTPVDPKTGLMVLDRAIAGGLNLGSATWLLTNGERLVHADNFIEIAKSLELAASQGSNAAGLILAELAIRGLAHPPCTRPCEAGVRLHLARLRAAGAERYAQFIEVSAGRITAVEALPGVSAVLGARAREFKQLSSVIKWDSKAGETLRGLMNATKFIRKP